MNDHDHSKSPRHDEALEQQDASGPLTPQQFLAMGRCPVDERPMTPVTPPFQWVGGAHDGATVAVFGCEDADCCVRAYGPPCPDSPLTLFEEFHFLLTEDPGEDYDPDEPYDQAIDRRTEQARALIPQALVMRRRIRSDTPPRGDLVREARELIGRMARAAEWIAVAKRSADARALDAWATGEKTNEQMKDLTADAWLLHGFFLAIEQLQTAIDNLFCMPESHADKWFRRLSSEGHMPRLGAETVMIVHLLVHLVGPDEHIAITGISELRNAIREHLGLGGAQCDAALERLQRLGLIEFDGNKLRFLVDPP